MGVCCTSSPKKNEKRSTNNKSSKDVKPDLVANDETYNLPNKPYQRPMFQYLISGDVKKIQDLIDRGEYTPNEYIGNGKTLLHEAIQTSNCKEVIMCLLDNKWDVDVGESDSGNTSLFIACLDFKVEFVETLLKYQPDIKIKNAKGHDVFTHVYEFFIGKNGVKKTDMTPEQKIKYDKINSMLNEYKMKMESVEVLDNHNDRKNILTKDNSAARIGRI